MVFTVLLLQGSGLAQGPYEKEWCTLYARIFRETVAAREQGDSLKDRLELLAKARRMREETHGESKEGTFHLSLIFWATLTVYKNPTYQEYVRDACENRS
jgi:hypothetical protein